MTGLECCVRESVCCLIVLCIYVLNHLSDYCFGNRNYAAGLWRIVWAVAESVRQPGADQHFSHVHHNAGAHQLDAWRSTAAAAEPAQWHNQLAHVSSPAATAKYANW